MLSTDCEADIDRLRFVTIDSLLVSLVEEAMGIQDDDERLKALRSIKDKLNELYERKIFSLENVQG